MPQAAREAVAAPLEAMSTSRLADVMAPKLGGVRGIGSGMSRRRLRPRSPTEPGLNALSRQGLQTKIAGKLYEAGQELDAAANARNANKVYNTGPIIQDLLKERAKLVAPTVRHAGMTAGADVVSDPIAPRVAAIDKVIGEVQQLGPIAHYESLRKIRQHWDIPAQVVYNPSITADFLVKQGYQRGAADATGVLRDRLATYDPATAAANARYSLFRKASDVLQATERSLSGLDRRSADSWAGGWPARSLANRRAVPRAPSWAISSGPSLMPPCILVSRRR